MHSQDMAYLNLLAKTPGEQRVRIEKSIGLRLKVARERQGLTLDAVGQELGQYLEKSWTPQAVWQAEQGQRDFRAAQLVAFALVLEVPVAQLLSPLEGDTEPVVIGSAYELTEQDVDLLFPAIGSPDGLALLHTEGDLATIAGELVASANAQAGVSELTRALADRVYKASDVLMGLVAKADNSPKVKARLARAERKVEGK